MKRYQVSFLFVAAIMAAFWAYMVIDTLLKDFSKDITYIDLGTIFILGLISGVALGLAIALGRKQPTAS